jgi:subtilase family serine protease
LALRTSTLVLALFAVAALAVPAQARTLDAATPDAATLRAELAAGTLLAEHGVREVCGNDTCQAQVVTTAPGSATPLSTSTPVGLGADDLARAYDFPPGWVGNRGTVAIVDFGAYPTLESDLAVYRAQYHLPPCTTANHCLRVTGLDGGAPPPASGNAEDQQAEEFSAVETSLDVDMVSAACPGCRIVVELGNDFLASGNPSEDQWGDGYLAGYATAVKLGANAVSISNILSSTPHLLAESKQLDHRGTPLFASIGDSPDSGDSVLATDDPPATEQGEWPQDLPWVVSVGGTYLKPDDASRSSFTEKSWKGLDGSCANTLPKADGQPTSIAADCHGFRAGSDISAVADPAAGPAVYDTWAPSSGHPQDWMVSGGTSASAPFTAAWFVRGAHDRQAEGPSELYAAPASAFNDITQGTGNDACATLNWAPALCEAGPGWDGPTGLGSPHGLGWF